MTEIMLLTPAQVADASQLGQATFDRWQGRPGYYRNLAGSHRRGKLGEVAVEVWAQRHGIAPLDAIFRDPGREREADLQLPFTLADVKTWHGKGWAAWGRCVAVKQLPTLTQKAAVVVWCHVSERRDVEITLAGWNTLGDVEAAPELWTGPEGKQVHNYQLAVKESAPNP